MPQGITELLHGRLRFQDDPRRLAIDVHHHKERSCHKCENEAGRQNAFTLPGIITKNHSTGVPPFVIVVIAPLGSRRNSRLACPSAGGAGHTPISLSRAPPLRAHLSPGSRMSDSCSCPPKQCCCTNERCYAMSVHEVTPKHS